MLSGFVLIRIISNFISRQLLTDVKKIVLFQHCVAYHLTINF